MILLSEGMEELREEVDAEGRLQVKVVRKGMKQEAAEIAGVIWSARNLKATVAVAPLAERGQIPGQSAGKRLFMGVAVARPQ
ncbi:MAG: hypothetical protein K9N23_01595 [Akkermansiaceae bacterium]|nr:hypothetical protein [Akkermansiaceae bacterium]MCF7730343.1 hypothetical protein [Akkermansiaceae bacterium]